MDFILQISTERSHSHILHFHRKAEIQEPFKKFNLWEWKELVDFSFLYFLLKLLDQNVYLNLIFLNHLPGSKFRLVIEKLHEKQKFYLQTMAFQLLPTLKRQLIREAD